MTGRITDILAGDELFLMHAKRTRPASGPSGGATLWGAFGSGEPITGNASDNFMFGGPQAPTIHNTINALDGDDFALGDTGHFIDFSGFAGNVSFATANTLEFSSAWTTAENPLFGDDSIPHLTAHIEASPGEEEWYSITVAAGETITIDIDYGGGPIGGETDTVVTLYNPSQAPVAANDDAAPDLGGEGSYESSPGGLSRDSYLTFTATDAGTYYIRVNEFTSGSEENFEGGEVFLINVSVTGHAVVASPAMGTDTIDGGEGEDALFGVGGDDFLYGGPGADALHGGSGIDAASYDLASAGVRADLRNPGANTGDAAGDIYHSIEDLLGSDFKDMLRATNGDNLVVGYAGNDKLYGRDGDDTLEGGLGKDRLDGGNGFDLVEYGSAAGKLVIDLSNPANNQGEAKGDGYVSIEDVDGGAFKDVLIGDEFDNILDGNGGADTLDGGDDADTLMGEGGRDVLVGGPGADTFVFESRRAGDADEIVDWAPGDFIELDGVVFNQPSGTLDPDRFVQGTAAGDANDRFIYDQPSGELYYDRDGTGAKAQVLIATFSNTPGLDATDLFVT